MKNVNKLLVELLNKGIIDNSVKQFLQRFLEQMHLENDIKWTDIDFLIREMSVLDFNFGSYSNTEFLSEKFQCLVPNLLAEGAIMMAVEENASSKQNLQKMLFVYCYIHDMTVTRN